MAAGEAQGSAEATEELEALAQRRVVHPSAARASEPRLVLLLCRERTHDGRKFRLFNLLDEITRECLAIRIDRRLRSTDVIDFLSDLFILRGVPDHLRSDNGPEFIAKVVREWIVGVSAKTADIEPGRPLENGYCESFTSCSTGRSSTVSPSRRSSTKAGAATTTPSARFHHLAIARRLPRSCSGRLRPPEPLRRPPQS